MGKPIVFVLDDDSAALQALAGDLARRFGDCRIVAERSAAAGLAALTGLAARSEDVAVLLADQRMPEMSGINFLARAHRLHPTAKRVLLVDRDYTDASPVVSAMTLGQIDYHLTKPWLPELSLYPAIGELLADWAKSQEPLTAMFRIVGPRWEACSHELRDQLARLGLPYAFYAEDSDDGRRLLREVGQDGSRLPVAVRHDGRVLLDPSRAEILQAIGVKTRNDAAVCDVAIVGAGPAGLTAAVCAASEGLQTLLVDPDGPGGQAGFSTMIRNYPGFPHGISGARLAYGACEQAWLFGADLVYGQAATGLRVHGADRILGISDGTVVAAKAVIIAAGVAWRRLQAPRLEALVGAGVFYGAAASEARAMEGQDVFVVGGANSAGQAAVHLAKYAATVTILARGESLSSTMSDYLIREIEAAANITVRLRTEVNDGHGEERLEAVTVRDRAAGTTETVPAAALFVLIGGQPHTAWLPDSVERDDAGYLLTGRDLIRDGRPPTCWPLERPPLLLETSIPGVFAAGDVRHQSVKRVASAVGEGATAIRLVHEYLSERPPERGSSGPICRPRDVPTGACSASV
jgi:thioredoxin reductase (NADPH)